MIKQATKQGYIEMESGGVADLSYPTSTTRRGRVQKGGTICPTLTTTTEVCKIDSEPLRIRKLTPKECFRLMGFDDNDIDILIQNGVSDTQLYKMAGNSIVVNMLEFLFCQIFDSNDEIWV